MSDKEQGPVSASATVTANVDLQPKASQIVLVSLVAFAALCTVCSTVLLYQNNNAGWGLMFMAAGSAFMAAKGWKKSQPDIDFHGAKATTLTLPDGTSISTDSRTLRDYGAAQMLIQISEACMRKKLPVADGLVKDGVIVPNSADVANHQVQQINAQVEVQSQAFSNLVNRPDSPTVKQLPTDPQPPVGSVPQLNGAVHTEAIGASQQDSPA